MKTLINLKAVYEAVTHIIRCVLFFLLCILFAPSPAILAEEEVETDQETLDAIDEEIRWLQSETYVITASNVMEEITKAPASITVINDRQIRQMGAKHLHDVISREIPSYSSVRPPAGTYRPYVRGLGERVLKMINSQPIYDVLWQGRPQWGYDTLPLENVKRIEFIRGPGSALYGANAYDGVINVITKGAEDIDGLELILRGGSWDTQQYNLLFGKTLKDLEAVLNFNYFKTHGHRSLIEEDMWTQLDQTLMASLGLPPLSLAPGHTKGDDERYDLSLNLKFKGFTVDGRYVDRDWNRPFIVGLGGALRQRSKLLVEDYYLNLKYETTIRDGLDLSVKGYRQQLHLTSDQQLGPPGVLPMPVQNPTPPPEVIFTYWPQGTLELFKYEEYHMGIEIQSTYKIHDSMTIVAGATYEKQRAVSGKTWCNYSVPEIPGGPYTQLPSLQLIADPPPWEGNYIAFFLEDIWDITQSIRLTTGLRYDEYFDFESEGYENLGKPAPDFRGHFSPRAGLTWEYMKGYDLKLLYGHAFVIPYGMTYRFASGHLDPQSVDTYEISLGAEFTSSLKGRITLYQRDEKDFIVVEDDDFTNIDELRSRGIEVEARYNFGRGTYLAGNYSYSSWPDKATYFYDVANIPEYSGKIMANIRLSRHFDLYTDCQHFGGMSRQSEEDLRDNISDYTIVNATLTARKFLKCCDGLELRASVYNLFDEDWSQFVVGMPYGWPQPGRNFLLELRYKF